MLSLLLFIVGYGALAGWFLWTAYRAAASAADGNRSLLGWIVAACAAFLGVFMLKSLFSMRKGVRANRIEVKREEQPLLFGFLDRLADDAGAPRPHRVFISADVNAAVFYDLSIFNLLFPSRKNLEIGLGLVNVLSLTEFKAVCAHEFGHFAQRSMAVSRWAYTAGQVAGHIVHARGAMDNLLDGLSRLDVRIAWVGFLLRLVVWAIRALTDSLFRLVILAQRALTRQMEMQADLVAVSLTGSDALIDALYKLQAADDAWDRTVVYLKDELGQGRVIGDAFAVQPRMLDRVGAMLGKRDYGKVVRDRSAPAAQRLFRAELAQPPRMWATHPLSHEREENAKRVYLEASEDTRSAWVLFQAAPALRERVTADLLGYKGDAAPVDIDASLERLDGLFKRLAHDRAYRGIYLGRAVTLHEANAGALAQFAETADASDLDRLYPESLARDMERLRELERENALLLAVQNGVYEAPGGFVHFRGRVLRRGKLAAAVAEVDRDLKAVRTALAEHDRRCRGLHRAAARAVGDGWEAYLTGLAELLHYAEHRQADLVDAHGALSNAVTVATATRRASSGDVTLVLKAADQLGGAARSLLEQAPAVTVGAAVSQALKQPNWASALGQVDMGRATRENINAWLNAAQRKFDHARGWLGALKQAALEELLRTEALLADAVRTGTHPGPAPARPSVPAAYAVATPDRARERQRQLSWWKRFQNAHGILPALVRGAAACSIVGGVIAFGWQIGTATVTVYNGLTQTVRVDIDGRAETVGPLDHRDIEMSPALRYKVRTTDVQGHEIEAFEARPDGRYAHSVYNVAGASPLVQWTAVYGPVAPRPNVPLGNPRWMATSADDVFTDPPRSVQSHHGEGVARDVLAAPGGAAPATQLELLNNDTQRAEVAAAHARWDSPHGKYLAYWLDLASEQKSFAGLLAARIAEHPDDVMAMRLRQDRAGEGKARICADDQARAAAAPDRAVLAYLSARCLTVEKDRDAAFDAGHARWPSDPWFANAAGYTASERGHWAEASADLELAIKREPVLAESLAVDLARIRRMQSGSPGVDLADLSNDSQVLASYLSVERGPSPDGEARAYAALVHGQLAQAVQGLQGGPQQARLLRLAASSAGASPELVQQALALPADKGIDMGTVWTAIALNLREGRDEHAFDGFLHKLDGRPDLERPIGDLMTFMHAASKGDIDGAQAQLHAMPPMLRGEAYAAGVVLLGARAPQSWRAAANCLLFAPERPFMG
jgi:Zn-dependent protease with chaperone function